MRNQRLHIYHAPVTRTLLQAGLHVITEKPFVVHPRLTGSGWQGYYKSVADHLLSGLPLLITPEWAKGTIQCLEGCETASRENRLVEVTFGF